MHGVLAGLNPIVVATMSKAVGMEIGEERIEKICKRANVVTLTGIEKSVKTLARLVDVALILRKVAKFVDEYKHFIIAYVLFKWAKRIVKD